MYAPGLGISENPFKLSPDPGCFFAAPTYEHAYRGIMDSIQLGKALVLVSGDPGTGKTTLLLKVMQELGESARVLYFPYTNLGPDALLRHICRQLGIADKDSRGDGDLKTLQDFFLQPEHAGELTVLLIDEAQNLDQEALAQISDLPNIAAANTVQVVLAGRPSVHERLDGFVATGERRVSCYPLTNLSNHEVSEYLNMRLRHVGCTRDELFTQETVTQLAQLTKGNPRLINIVCGNALAVADRNARTRLSEELIEVGAVMGAKVGGAEGEAGSRVETILARIGAEPPAATSQEVPVSTEPSEAHEVRLLQAMQEDIAAQTRAGGGASPESGRARVPTTRLSTLSASLRRITLLLTGRHEQTDVTDTCTTSWRSTLARLALSCRLEGERLREGCRRLGSRIADSTQRYTKRWMTHPRTHVSSFSARTQAGLERSTESTGPRLQYAGRQVASKFQVSMERLWRMSWSEGLFARCSRGRLRLAAFRNRFAAHGVRNALVFASLSAIIVSAWLMGGTGTRPLEDAPVAADESEFGSFSADDLHDRVQDLTYRLEQSLAKQERLTRELADVREERDWLATRLRGVAHESAVAADSLGGRAQTETQLHHGQELSKVPDYTVKKGDTLWAIALEQGVSVANLEAWNGIQANDVLQVGQQLTTSPPRGRQSAIAEAADSEAQSVRYVVQRGDSLYRIAKRFDVTVAQLRAWNNLEPDRHLQPQQQLTVMVGNTANTAL